MTSVGWQQSPDEQGRDADDCDAATQADEAAAHARWISQAERGADGRDLARLWYQVAVDAESAETERQAAATDREAARTLLVKAWRDRRAAAADREAAARDRKAAAEDRKAAARDRQAALERTHEPAL